MNPPDIQAKIELLDITYQKVSGFQFKLRGVITGREQAWAEFIQRGFTMNDLDTVLCYLNSRIREGKRDPGSKRFSTLIQNLDRFDEELAMATASKRKPVTTNKERIVAQARPVVCEPEAPDSTKPIKSIIPDLIAQMRAAVK